MKIKKEHIGQKFVFNRTPGYFLLEGILQIQSYTFVYGESYGKHLEYGNDPPLEHKIVGKNYFVLSGDEINFTPYVGSGEDFDYKAFGCNAEAVEKLIRHLDTKYETKGK